MIGSYFFAGFIAVSCFGTIFGQLFPTPRPNQNENAYAMRIQNRVAMLQSLNEPQCSTDSGTIGSCISHLQCRRRGGRPSGFCRTGIFTKSCCQEVRSCEEQAIRNNTYFQQPSSSWQNLPSLQCRLHVHKLPGVCQLRLDFHQFSLRGPEASTGKCDRDRFSVNGQDSNSVVPSICGENARQHMYVDVSSVQGPFNLLLTTSDKSGDSSMARQWNIQVAQIPCTSIMRAPQGCLQYFTGLSVQNFRSWNYDNGRTGEATYPSGMDYTVCIRKELGMCAASFESEGNFGLEAITTDNPKFGGSSDCAQDYLLFGERRYCGGKNLPVMTPGTQTDDTPRLRGTGPLVVAVVTGTSARTVQQNQNLVWPGFNVRYRQDACNAI